MTKQNILLIVNPVAGKKKGKHILFQIVDLFCRNNYKPTVFITAKKGDAADIVMENAKDFQKIFCCGGDGTLNEVLTGLRKIDLLIPVGYIPTGTTNDLASALKLPSNVGEAINNISKENIRLHDMGKFNGGQYFSYVASFGAFVKASYITPQWSKNLFGRVAYIFRSILSIPDIRSHTVKVVADGREITDDFVYGSVSNSTVIGGILRFPEADIHFDDGMFEVLLIKNPKNYKELKKIVKCISQNIYNDEYVYYFKAKKISFSFEKCTEWTIDGEYAGNLDSVYIENLARSAQIIST